MERAMDRLPESVRPRLDVLWLWKFTAVLLATFSLIGFFVCIWHAVDLTTNRAEVYELVALVADDVRLLQGLYVLMFFTLVVVVLSIVRLATLPTEDGAAKLGRWEPFQGTITVLYVVFLFGYFISVVLGGIYKHRTLPHVKPGLMAVLSSNRYMLREPNARWVFSETGARFNHLQATLTCCGLNDVTDYAAFNFSASHEGELFPYSCCQLAKGSDWRDPDLFSVVDWLQCQQQTPPHFHDRGCMGVLGAWLQDKADFLLGYGVFLMTLAAIQCALTALFVYGFRKQI